MKIERNPDKPYARDAIYRPTPEHLERLRSWAMQVEQGQGRMCARDVALEAVLAGMLLIGTPVSKPVHYPVPPEEHRHYDIRDRGRHKFHERRNFPGPLPEKSLRAGKNPDIAIMCGLFGDYNSREERMETSTMFTQREDRNHGWGNDAYREQSESWRYEYYAQEGSPVGLFARPALINAAREDRLRGSIDCIYDDEAFDMTVYDVAQFIGPVVAETVFSIPLRGFDLPIDVIPSRYNDTRNLAM